MGFDYDHDILNFVSYYDTEKLDNYPFDTNIHDKSISIPSIGSLLSKEKGSLKFASDDNQDMNSFQAESTIYNFDEYSQYIAAVLYDKIFDNEIW